MVPKSRKYTLRPLTLVSVSGVDFKIRTLGLDVPRMVLNVNVVVRVESEENLDAGTADPVPIIVVF